MNDARADSSALEPTLLRALRARFHEARAIEGLRLLSGGASQESWWLDLVLADDERRALILRRAPAGGRPGTFGPSKEDEARVQTLARDAGVPAAEVVHVLAAADGLGPGYVMERVAGESLAPKILREESFAAARRVLARQCGSAAARIHALGRRALSGLRVLDATALLELYRRRYDSFGDPHPVFEWALRWLAQRVPPAVEPRLVHGDFRLGNLIVGPEGLRAVLDWEVAHLGDPMEDLGTICVPSWRFGAPLPVGGFGSREELFAAYQSAGGGAVDPKRVRWWEIFGSLRWGIDSQSLAFAHLLGHERSVEQAAIGRRGSETEADLLHRILVEDAVEAS